MSIYEHIEGKKESIQQKATNIVELKRKAQIERKQEKRKTILIAAALASALAVSGFMISQ